MTGDIIGIDHGQLLAIAEHRGMDTAMVAQYLTSIETGMLEPWEPAHG